MNVLFFGTPHSAVPFLDWVCQHQTVAGVVCQPDRPSGRGYDVSMPAVKSFAVKNGLPVFQPQGPWTEETLLSLKKCQADIGVVVAYGRIIPESVFTLPRLGCINIHFSLLPRYRGAAPIQWALMNGETQTGVSAFWLDQGMDTGPLSHQKACSIDENDNAVSLREKLTVAGIQVLSEFFCDAEKNRFIKTPQMGEPSKAPIIKKELGKIDWTKSAASLHHLVRGLVEWPTATTTYVASHGKKLLKISATKILNSPAVTLLTEGKIGERHGVIKEASSQHGIVVQTGSGLLSVLEVQPEGKKMMGAWEFWQGAHLKVGDQLGL